MKLDRGEIMMCRIGGCGEKRKERWNISRFRRSSSLCLSGFIRAKTPSDISKTLSVDV